MEAIGASGVRGCSAVHCPATRPAHGLYCCDVLLPAPAAVLAEPPLPRGGIPALLADARLHHDCLSDDRRRRSAGASVTTGSALALRLIGLAQFPPALLLVLPAGQIADRHDRRQVAARAQRVSALAAALLALGSLGDWLTVHGIYALVLVIGAARAFERRRCRRAAAAAGAAARLGSGRGLGLGDADRRNHRPGAGRFRLRRRAGAVFAASTAGRSQTCSWRASSR